MLKYLWQLANLQSDPVYCRLSCYSQNPEDVGPRDKHDAPTDAPRDLRVRCYLDWFTDPNFEVRSRHMMNNTGKGAMWILWQFGSDGTVKELTASQSVDFLAHDYEMFRTLRVLGEELALQWSSQVEMSIPYIAPASEKGTVIV